MTPSGGLPPAKVQKRFSEVLGKADAIASRVKNDTQQGGDAVGKTLNTLSVPSLRPALGAPLRRLEHCTNLSLRCTAGALVHSICARF